MNLLRLVPVTLLVSILSYGCYYLLKEINNEYLAEEQLLRSRSIDRSSIDSRAKQELNAAEETSETDEKSAAVAVDKKTKPEDRVVVLDPDKPERETEATDSGTPDPLLTLLYDNTNYEAVVENKTEIDEIIKLSRERVNKTKIAKDLIKK